MERPGGDRPISQLLGVLANQVQQLIRTECQLARQEIGESLGKTRGAIVLIVIGSTLLLPALTIFLLGIVNALVQAGMRADLAAFAVGALVGAMGIIAVLTGMNRAKTVNFLPKKSLSQLERDFTAVNPLRQKNEHTAA